jgi:hypothetical protein
VSASADGLAATGQRCSTVDHDFVNPPYGRVHGLCWSATYGRLVSSVMENRAAVFTNQSQAVEVYRAGTWSAGELLGWRHDEGGACQVWVRVVVGGVEETGWTDLAALRLPEAPAVEAGPVVTDAETTASLPLARDHVVTEASPVRSGGRRRAPEVAESAPVRSGGRRRAPEDADVRRASASSVPVPAPGRHRAPSADPDAGRHRDADTELFSAIVDEPAPSSRQRRDDLLATATWSMPAARPVPAAEKTGRESTRSARDELLTRPMRLNDQVPQSRRPRSMAR